MVVVRNTSGLSEERPLIVELTRDNLAALVEAGSRLRRAEARALHIGAAFVEAFEHAEHPLPARIRNADACVGHLKTQLASFDERGQGDTTAVRRELHRIRHEVEEDLADARRIEEERREVGHLHRERHTLGLRGQRFHVSRPSHRS